MSRYPLARTLARRPLATIAAAAGLGLASGAASATWSIVLVDISSGEVALGSATCLTGFDLRANTPVMIVGVGGATAQSFVDSRSYNRTFIRDRLAQGVAPGEIISQLAGFDAGHQTRQYGIGDTLGRVTTFSGTQAGEWKGGVVGSFQSIHQGRTSTIAYAIQGNVLAGAPVVDEAVRAVVETPGDLAAKLMAGMEAAHEMGGDGRCSCGSPPDGCGAPPAGFDPLRDKSAHIAYMLIGRLGDTDACMGVYPFPRALDVATADLDGDGVREALAIENSQLWLLANTGHGSPFVRFDPPEHVANFSGTGRSIVAGDVNGDGHADAVIATANGGVVVFPGRGDRTFAQGFSLPAGGGISGVVLTDLNGDGAQDIAVTTGTANTLEIHLSDGAGGFQPRQSVLMSGSVFAIDALDADADGDTDFVAVLPNTDEVQIAVNDDGVFSRGPRLAIQDDPMAIAAADLDDDGMDDFVVVHRAGRGVTIMRQAAAGAFARTDVSTDDRLVDVAIRDMDSDGDLDIAFLNLGGSFFGALENIGGAFDILDQDYRASGGAPAFAVDDMTGDGLPDVVFAAGNVGVAATANLGDGPVGLFPDAPGCAAGDYWMTFNVANQNVNDPDPTLQLRGLFDTWRQDLVGRPDAVVSVVRPLGVLPPDGQTVGTLRVELRDWRGEAITFPVALEAARAAGSTSDSEVVAIRQLGSGVFEVDVRAGATVGIDRLLLTTDDGVRPVTLMPAPLVRVGVEPADLNADGSVDVNDFFLFLDAFAAGDLAVADLTSTANQGDPGYGVPDGVIDVHDFFFYLDLFVG